MTPRDAAAELLRRRQIRASLSGWCRHALAPVGQAPAAHHELIIRELLKVTAGETDRLMILMPPGSAKSTYTSVLYPAFWFAQRPQTSIIAASNTQENADRFGRKVRNLIAENATALGYGVSADNAAAGRWETTKGGDYFAVGIGGTVTSRRADLILIDDPIKGRKDADSKLVRDTAWDWYRDDLRTRLKPGGRIVLVLTRWHEDDLGGRLLADMESGGEQWKVLSVPMEAESNDPLGRAPGERLWPEWFTDSMVAQAKRDTRGWSSLYQQRPTPDTGDYFHKDWIRPVLTLPPASTLRVFGASDYAVTSDGGDYTVHVVLGVDADDRLYLLDLWRGQASSDRWVEAFCDLVVRWKPMGWAEETGQIRAGIGPWLDRRQRERRAFVVREAFPTRGDKSVRAQSIRGRMALNGLYVPQNADWRADLESELLSFPAGKHDDQVDALGLVGQLLDVMMPPGRPENPPGPVDTWARAFNRSNDDGDDGWKVA